MKVMQIHKAAPPSGENFASFPFRYMPEDPCMDAPFWMPAGACRRFDYDVPYGRMSRPLQVEVWRSEWS